MCGIAGIFNLDGAPADARVLRAMASRLAHRGPDGEGVFVDGSLGLAHRRLAILDPTPQSDQPFTSADGRYTVVFNGEIYNFLELREELEPLGHRFRTDSDTEVLVAAYAQWGEGCQLRFNGMWAFAVWDATARTLFLSRDRFGIKPLFTWSDGRRFAFASEMKGLLGLDGFEARFDPGAMAYSLIQGGVLDGTEHTVLTGVRRLRGGCSLTVVPGHAPERRCWWHTLRHLPSVPARVEDQADLVRELFLDAVALRLRSDVPLGTALSGGFDSSAVHCAMVALDRLHRPVRRAPADRFKAFVAGFPGTAQNETEYARAVVRHCGTTGLFHDEDPNDLAPWLATMIYHQEAISSAAPVQWLLYRRMRARGVLVSLDGHGGDELFAGYHHQVAAGLDHARDPRVVELFRQTLDQMRVAGQEGFGRSEVMPIHFVRAEQASFALPEIEEDRDEIAALDPINLTLYMDLHYLTLPNILANFDRASMAHGVEVRAPFLDWRLVTTAMALPWGAKIAHGFSKYVARVALADLMPAEVVQRRGKLGYVCPMATWLPGPLRGLMLDTLGERAFLDSGLWDGPAVKTFADAALAAGDGETAANLWPFVHAHLLMKSFHAPRL